MASVTTAIELFYIRLNIFFCGFYNWFYIDLVMDWGVSFRQDMDVSVLSRFMTMYDPREISLVVGEHSIQCPLILLAHYSERIAHLVTTKQEIEKIELDIPEEDWPQVERLVSFVQGHAISVDFASVFPLARLSAILCIPRLAEHLYPYTHFVSRMSEIYQRLSTGADIDIASANFVAPYFCVYPEFRALIDRLSDETLLKIFTSVNFRVSSEDELLNMVIHRRDVLVKAVRMQCLSPDGLRKIFQTYSLQTSGDLLVARLRDLAATKNLDWKKCRENNPRYDVSQEAIQRSIYEGVGGVSRWTRSEVEVDATCARVFESFPIVTIDPARM